VVRRCSPSGPGGSGALPGRYRRRGARRPPGPVRRTTGWTWRAHPRGRAWCSRQVQPVTEPSNGDQQTGLGSINLDLGPQPADVNVDDPFVAEVAVVPDPLQ